MAGVHMLALEPAAAAAAAAVAEQAAAGLVHTELALGSLARAGQATVHRPHRSSRFPSKSLHECMENRMRRGCLRRRHHLLSMHGTGSDCRSSCLRFVGDCIFTQFHITQYLAHFND
tara:strand:- start:127 stop:477 length:351 start_codon:yes stop_codon:yes gene_type:complete